MTCCLEKHKPRVRLGAFWIDTVISKPREGLSTGVDSVDHSLHTHSLLEAPPLSVVAVLCSWTYSVEKESNRNWYI